MMSIDQLFGTINTGNGFWNPFALIIVIVVAFLLVYIIRGIGKNGEKKKKRKIRSIPVAEKEYEKERKHMKDCNIYWSFIESLAGLFKTLEEKIHSESVRDYLMWFVIIMAILLLLVVVI